MGIARRSNLRKLQAFFASAIFISFLTSGGRAQNQQPQSQTQAAPQEQQPADPRVSLPPPQLRASQNGTIRAVVDLVQVDVQVTDRNGKTMKGLRQDQFTVTEDSKEQKISAFDYYDVETVETAAKGDRPPLTISIGAVAQPDQLRQVVRDHRLIVLFFDLTSLQPEDLNRTSASAKRFVREQMTAADLVAVVVFGNQLRVVTDFTTDRDLLYQAVDAILPGKDSQLAALADATAQNGEDAVTQDAGAAFTADDTEFNVFNTDRKLIALESLADLLHDIPGKKSVMEFTSGVTQTGEENRMQLRATTDAANRANVSIYSVDSRGLIAQVPGGDATTASASGTSLYSGAAVLHQDDAREDSRETLSTLASDTGGRAFFDLGDLGSAFQAVQADTAGYYLLGYYSNNGARDGRWRTLHVRVSGVAGARVRFREGYYAPKDFGVYTTEDRERQLEDAIRSDTPLVELPLAVDTASFRLDKNQFFVPISAKLASSALQWAQKSGRHEVQFDFAAEIRATQSSRVMGALRDTITVKLDSQQFEQVQQNALVYQGGIILPPGDYKLKFLVRENESGRIGTFEDALKIPTVTANRVEVSTVLLSSQLVEAAKNSGVQTKAYGADAKLKQSPLEINGQRIIPSVTRVFTNQQTLFVFFQAYLPDTSDPGRLRSGLTFFRNGARVSETPLVAPAQVDENTHVASFRISLPLSGMAAGRYTVQAVVVETGGAQAAFGRSYFVVRPPVPAISSSGN